MGRYPAHANQFFDKNRILFCIRDNQLHIDERRIPRSHLEWFRAAGWVTEDDDSAIQLFTRGAVEGEPRAVYFYRGFDFGVSVEAEREFFAFLLELQQRLHLPQSTNIYGGKVPSGGSDRWAPRKSYGMVGDYLK